MKYEFTLHLPGIAGYEKRTNYPVAFEPQVTPFEAASHTEAANIAAQMYRDAVRHNPDLKSAIFNVGRA
jgi:hypothetical protein